MRTPPRPRRRSRAFLAHNRRGSFSNDPSRVPPGVGADHAGAVMEGQGIQRRCSAVLACREMIEVSVADARRAGLAIHRLRWRWQPEPAERPSLI
jgi:hypothetical protein